MRAGCATGFAVWLLLGCGGSASHQGEATTDHPSTSGAETATASEDALPAPPSEWASMSHEAKAAWMSEEVMPRMRVLFAEFDAERYPSIRCSTCHGPTTAEGVFTMPNLALPALSPTGSPEQRAMVREYPEMLHFMFQRVLPTVRTLVGGASYDAETQEGFSCYSCHPHAGDEGSTPVRLRTESLEQAHE